MRASVGLMLLLVGCPGCFAQRGCACVTHGPVPVDAGSEASVLSCDRPTIADPSLVVDVATFRAEASAVVCDFSLRCGWGSIGDPFCHPAFAEREGTTGPMFDVALARTCVAQLGTAVDCGGAQVVAIDCRALNEGRAGLVGEGEACVAPDSRAPCGSTPCPLCSFGLACVAGICARTVGVGGACDASHPCSINAECHGGSCAVPPFPPFAQLGDDCSVLPCAPGLACQACLGGNPARFCDVGGAPVSPPLRHHAGCPCTSDADCPTSVAACVGGVCTLRPFPGDACSLGGAPCFVSRCASSGVCAPLGLGDGPCGLDSDCEAGLACATSIVAPRPLTCVRALQLGDACTPDVVGECRASCCNGSVCAGSPGGGLCTACGGCAAGLACDATTQTCR